MAPFLTVHSTVFDCVQPVRVLPSNMETRFGSPNGLVGARVSAEAFTAETATAAARTAPAASIQNDRRGTGTGHRPLPRDRGVAAAGQAPGPAFPRPW